MINKTKQTVLVQTIRCKNLHNQDIDFNVSFLFDNNNTINAYYSASLKLNGTPLSIKNNQADGISNSDCFFVELTEKSLSSLQDILKNKNIEQTKKFIEKMFRSSYGVNVFDHIKKCMRTGIWKDTNNDRFSFK